MRSSKNNPDARNRAHIRPKTGLFAREGGHNAGKSGVFAYEEQHIVEKAGLFTYEERHNVGKAGLFAYEERHNTGKSGVFAPEEQYNGKKTYPFAPKIKQMPYRRLPNTDDTRLKALQTAKEKAESTDPALWAITAETKTRLDTLYTRLSREMQERGTALAGQAPATQDEDSSMVLAERFMSHFWQVFNLAIARNKYQEGDRAYYQAPVGSKDIPWAHSEAEIVLWGSRLIAGEAARVAAGGVPMTNPDIAEVQTAYDAFIVVHDQQSTEKDKYDDEQKDVEDMRPEVDEFIRYDLWDAIEYHFRKEEPSSLRRKAHEWGVIYVSRPDEEPEEGVLPPEVTE